MSKVNLYLIVLVFLQFSCKVNKEYSKAISSNTISNYEEYLKKFPKSKHKMDVEFRLNNLLDEQSWKQAQLLNTIEVYKKYITDFPKSSHKQEVEFRLNNLYDEQSWKNANSTFSILVFKNYINQFPNGKYVIEARNNIEKLEKIKEVEDVWNKCKMINSIVSYQSFIDLYPSSSLVIDARLQIENLKELKEWDIAFEQNTIESYNNYLKKFPKGKFSYTAINKIDEINEEKIILPIWKSTIRINTYKAFNDFLDKYPYSTYSDLAKEKLIEIEENDWEKAFTLNSIKLLSDCIKKYPYSYNIDDAEKKIIDLEVDKIFKGDYGQLPPMSKNNYNYSASSTNSISIYNRTKYTLTVRYSGVESKKIVLIPGERTTISLKFGNYRIAASVNAANVRNYAGSEYLSSGEYSSEFYIKTTTTR